jgi:peptide deformylase
MPQIITNTNDLHIVSKPLPPEEFERVKGQLFGFLWSVEGQHAAGIASVQLGEPVSAFAFWRKPDNDPPFLEFVANPEILERVDAQYKSYEGCMSIPGVRCLVPRYPQLTIRYEGSHDLSVCEDRTWVIYDEDARVFQHEFDHTQGILITDVGIVVPKNIGRNDQCPCRSGRKWKKCCGRDI